MGEVADRLAALTVRVSSPDGNVRATVKAGLLESVRFRPGAYADYTEDGLAWQIGRAATLLYVGHERGVAQIMREAGLNRRKDPAQARDEAERRYLEKVFTIPATATGPRGQVRLSTVGMLSWACRIKTGALALLREDEFVAEAGATAGEILRRTAYEAALLKDECFGLNLPDLAEERRRRRERAGRG
ncbi:hypothetical protein AB0I28_29810 [Phytomonospora sp. NPDC050363]|uniref:hypothetical protein n=1 Tax=Phytomonospora sp. NPDC050363 TaxID=3155642 RepID=UPI0033C9F54D